MKMNKKALLGVQIVLGIFAMLVLFYWFTSCGPQNETKTVQTPPAAGVCGGNPQGSVRSTVCPAGQSGSIIQTCAATGWVDTQNTCGASQASCTTFEQIKPLITQYCLGCHTSPQPYDRYDVAASLGSDMIARINLPSADTRRMPKFPNNELSFGNKQLFQQWSADGFKEKAADCANASGKLLQLDDIETAILNDLNQIDPASQKNIRYVISSHKNNAGASTSDLRLFNLGIQKAANSLSQDRDISLLSPVDKAGSVWRLDLLAFKLSAASWAEILTADRFKFVSFTSKGQQIKQLTGTSQPWLHSDNFVFSANQPAVYNNLLAIPATRGALFDRLGVNFQQNFDQFQVLNMGFNGSPISLNKNRSLAKVKTNDGYLWISFDTEPGFAVPQRNLFQFPLLKEAKGTATFLFDASEFIFTLPNGLQGYALYDAAEQRANAAPTTIVHDTNSPFQDEIQNGISCHRCHNQGIIPAVDQIRQSVTANASQFDARDVQLVQALYKGAAAGSATIAADNKLFNAATAKLGITAKDPDPINFLSDSLRRDMTAKDVAAFMFLSESKFKDLLNGSAQGKIQIGQLLSGGTISLEQLITTFPILVQDFRLGQDPIR